MKYLKFSDIFPTSKGKPLTREQMIKLARKVNKSLIKEKVREIKQAVLDHLM